MDIYVKKLYVNIIFFKEKLINFMWNVSETDANTEYSIVPPINEGATTPREVYDMNYSKLHDIKLQSEIL